MTQESQDVDVKIDELKSELKRGESAIAALQERLKNNEDMLKDSIAEKKELKQRLQQIDLHQNDAKIGEYQKLLEDHQKTVHRLEVTKKHLDNAKDEIAFLKEVIDELASRNLLDHLFGRYPESFHEYKGS